MVIENPSCSDHEQALASLRSSTSSASLHNLDQWNRIDNWLQDLYAAKVPDYEKDDITLQGLNELHAKTMEANNVMEMVLQIQKEIGDEHLRQATVWQGKLNALDLSRSSMSNEGNSALDALVLLATRLGLDNTLLSSYQTALAHLTVETMDANIEVRDLKDTEHALQSRIDNAESELNKMKATLSSMRRRHQEEEKDLVQHWHKNAIALEHQIETAKPKYAKMQREFEATEVEQQEVRLSAINKLEQEIRTLEAVLAQKNSVISTCSDLPPDMMLASLKLKETQNHLHHRQQEREQLLADIANHIR